MALYKIQHMDELSPEEKKQLKVHTAGGIAKIAYKLIKEGEEPKIFEYYCPRIKKNNFDIENNEKKCNKEKSDRKSDPGLTYRIYT